MASAQKARGLVNKKLLEPLGRQESSAPASNTGAVYGELHRHLIENAV
jgi:hypothetical protein